MDWTTVEKVQGADSATASGGASENSGKWTDEESRRFLEGLELHGKGKWKEIAAHMKSRTNHQVCRHAEQYFKKLAAEREGKCRCNRFTKARGGSTRLQVLHNLLSQPQKTIDGVRISDDTINWTSWQSVGPLLSDDAKIIVPQLGKTVIQIHSCEKVADHLMLPNRDEYRTNSLLSFLTSTDWGAGGVLFAYDKELGKIDLGTPDAIRDTTALILGLGPGNLMVPNTSWDQLKRRKTADPVYHAAVLARQVKWQFTYYCIILGILP